MKKWFEIWLPTFMFIAIILGVFLLLWGALAGITWMFVTGICLFIGGLISKAWIL